MNRLAFRFQRTRDPYFLAREKMHLFLIVGDDRLHSSMTAQNRLPDIARSRTHMRRECHPSSWTSTSRRASASWNGRSERTGCHRFRREKSGFYHRRHGPAELPPATNFRSDQSLAHQEFLKSRAQPAIAYSCLRDLHCKLRYTRLHIHPVRQERSAGIPAGLVAVAGSSLAPSSGRRPATA